MTDKKIVKSVSELGRKFSDVTIAMHEAIARNAGLTGTDHKYLSMLVGKGPMTAGELAKISRLTTGAVTSVIDRLEKKKLVKRVYDKQDRRKVIIEADTAKAEKLLKPSFNLLQGKILALVSKLSEEEKNIIEKYLIDTIKAMEEVTATLSGEK